MKVHTITCHDVYNYGASLQAYALQTYLISVGHESYIIDYKPNYLRRNYNFWYIEETSQFYKLCNKSIFFHFLYSLRLVPLTYRTWRRIIPFNRFKREYLFCTKQYDTLLDLQQDPPIGDIYIAGSDQIWNCNLPNGKDNAFFLDFGPQDTKRISYAASIGVAEFPYQEQDRIAHLLKAFNSISVRELTAEACINSMGFTCKTVCDPVFLLTKDQWYNIIPKKSSNLKYLLVYDIFTDDNSICEAAIKKSSELNIPIFAINDTKKCRYANVNISNAGPIEFLWYLQNAEYIISNSFHATAFAILFNKQFSTFYYKSNSSRISDLLNSLGLLDHFNSIDVHNVIDWDNINEKLRDFIVESKKFLETVLI